MNSKQRIKDACKDFNVRLWEVAERLRISDSTFSRMLRKQLSEFETERLIAIIKDINDCRDKF